MKIVLTGSLGNIGKHLTAALIKKGYAVTVISSQPQRAKDIEAMGATPTIGSMFDVDFLSTAFHGAEIVYLMETMEAAGDMFDKSVDFIATISQIGRNYKQAVAQAGVKKVIHLSSVGAHLEKGNGILLFHHKVEGILNELPADVAIKFMRPVGFFINMYSFINTIKNTGAIIANYGGDKKEPWVHPIDVAATIAEEMDTPFEGRIIRYIASDEVSPDQVAAALGRAIGRPDLQWKVISSQSLLEKWLSVGFNKQVAEGFIDMQESQGNGLLYEDYYHHQPVLGRVKLADFAKEFAAAFEQE